MVGIVRWFRVVFVRWRVILGWSLVVWAGGGRVVVRFVIEGGISSEVGRFGFRFFRVSGFFLSFGYFRRRIGIVFILGFVGGIE